MNLARPQDARTATVPHPRCSKSLSRFAWFTAAATLLLICSGGMVTSKGVGLAVPDWPTTFGYNMFLFPVSRWVGGILFEHTHRLAASTVGFLTIVLALWLWRSNVERWVKTLGWLSLGAVIFQGILGGLRVTLLKDEIGIFHACLAQAFLGLLVVIALATSPRWHRFVAPSSAPRLLRFALVISALIYAQLGLGATMRHQHRDLAILDFPLTYGQIIPATDPATIARINVAREAQAMSTVSPAQIWLQMAHRILAAVILCGIVGYRWALGSSNGALRRLGDAWVVCVACQVALGATVIWSNKAADIATAHVAVGAVSFCVGVAISALLLRPGRAPSVLPVAHLAETRVA